MILRALLASLITIASSISAAEPLDLEALLTHAEAHAPALIAARAAARVSEGAVIDAEPLLPAEPELSVSYGRRARGDDAAGEVEVELSQALEISGARGLRRAHARAARRAAEAEVGEALWRVHAQVHEGYLEQLVLEARRRHVERFMAFSEALYAVASKRVEAGEAWPARLMVAEADRAQSREALIEIDRLITSGRARLGALIGWEGALPPLAGALPPAQRVEDPEALLEALRAHNPTLRRWGLGAEAASALVDLERRARWPQPTLGLGYGHEAGLGEEPEAHVWRVGVSVPLPLWRRNRGAIVAAEATRDHARRAAAADEARLRGALLAAVADLNAAADRVALYERDVMPQIEGGLKQLKRAYDLGEIDIHQISQVRQRLLTATHHGLDARVDYLRAAARLEGLVGAELWPLTEAKP